MKRCASGFGAPCARTSFTLSYSFLTLLAIALLIFVCSQSALAQVGTGFLPLTSHQSSSFDSVELNTLNVHFDIPIVQKAGRGMPFNYVLSYDSNIWSPWQNAWIPVTGWGWRGISEASVGYVTYWEGPWVYTCGDGSRTRWFTNWAYHDPQGGVHPFPGVQIDLAGCFDGQPVGTTNDGSGYTISVSVVQQLGVVKWLYTRSGSLLNPPVQSPSTTGKITDRNGNIVSTDGTHFTDTLSTTALTVTGGPPPNPIYYTYTPPSGTPVSIKMTFAQYTVSGNFGCSFTAFPATPEYLVSAIQLPDGNQYIFQYDSSGRMNYVQLPTGGQIHYTYTGGTNGEWCDGSTAGLTRQTPDGTWTYTRSGTPSASTTTVTDPAQNQTLVTFSGGYETARKIYQGTTTLLETIYNCYNTRMPLQPTADVRRPQYVRRSFRKQLSFGWEHMAHCLLERQTSTTTLSDS